MTSTRLRLAPMMADSKIQFKTASGKLFTLPYMQMTGNNDRGNQIPFSMSNTGYPNLNANVLIERGKQCALFKLLHSVNAISLSGTAAALRDGITVKNNGQDAILFSENVIAYPIKGGAPVTASAFQSFDNIYFTPDNKYLCHNTQNNMMFMIQLLSDPAPVPYFSVYNDNIPQTDFPDGGMSLFLNFPTYPDFTCKQINSSTIRINSNCFSWLAAYFNPDDAFMRQSPDAIKNYVLKKYPVSAGAPKLYSGQMYQNVYFYNSTSYDLNLVQAIYLSDNRYRCEYVLLCLYPRSGLSAPSSVYLYIAEKAQVGPPIPPVSPA